MADLLRRQVSTITAIGNSQVVAAKAASTTIPIVFLTGEDAVRIGFVASLQPPRRAQPKWAERKSPVRLGGAEENASNEVWGHPTLHKPTTR